MRGTIADLRDPDNKLPTEEDAYLATELEKILARLDTPFADVVMQVCFVARNDATSNVYVCVHDVADADAPVVLMTLDLDWTILQLSLCAAEWFA